MMAARLATLKDGQRETVSFVSAFSENPQYMEGRLNESEPTMTFLQAAYLAIALSYLLAVVAMWAGH